MGKAEGPKKRSTETINDSSKQRNRRRILRVRSVICLVFFHYNILTFWCHENPFRLLFCALVWFWMIHNKCLSYRLNKYNQLLLNVNLVFYDIMISQYFFSRYGKRYYDYNTPEVLDNLPDWYFAPMVSCIYHIIWWSDFTIYRFLFPKLRDIQNIYETIVIVIYLTTNFIF